MAASLQEQVLVAALPGQAPEVHIASLDAERKVVRLHEACVGGSGEVAVGEERVVPLLPGTKVELRDNMLGVVGPKGDVIMMLHMESTEDQEAWRLGMNAVIAAGDAPKGVPGTAAACAAAAAAGAGTGPAGAAEAPGSGGTQANAPQDGDEELVYLRARNEQLKVHISKLQATAQRRDRQLSRMMQRVDGALQMLGAVHDMTAQQKKVIEAQRTAVKELEAEISVGDARGNADGASKAPAQARTPAWQGRPGPEAAPGAQAQASEDSQSGAEGILQMLQQADEMQRALRLLESVGVTPGSVGSAAAEHPADAREDVSDPGAQAMLSRLRMLEAEKARFEDMLSDSQGEHEMLQQRLAGMRSLLGELGMSEED